MTDKQKVIVLALPKVITSSAAAPYVARLSSLGLTAYGDTLDASLQKLERMFLTTINAHRNDETLEEWLDNSVPLTVIPLK